MRRLAAPFGPMSSDLALSHLHRDLAQDFRVAVAGCDPPDSSSAILPPQIGFQHARIAAPPRGGPPSCDGPRSSRSPVAELHHQIMSCFDQQNVMRARAADIRCSRQLLHQGEVDAGVGHVEKHQPGSPSAWRQLQQLFLLPRAAAYSWRGASVYEIEHLHRPSRISRSSLRTRPGRTPQFRMHAGLVGSDPHEVSRTSSCRARAGSGTATNPRRKTPCGGRLVISAHRPTRGLSQGEKNR